MSDENVRAEVEACAVVRYASRPLGKAQIDALVSFADDVGLDALRRSKLLALVRNWSANPETSSEAEVVLEWLAIEGPTNRRRAEVALFFGVDV